MSGENRRRRANRKKSQDTPKTEPERDRQPDPHRNQPARLDKTEIMIAVCDLVLQKRTAAEIVAHMARVHSVEVTLKSPLIYMREAAQRGWFRLEPPGALQLQAGMRNRFDWLQGLAVVHSVSHRHVSRRGAQMLQKLVKQLACEAGGQETVRIGWGGGLQTRDLADDFIRLLSDEPDGWPAQIVIHSMISGVNPEDPSLDPGAMFLYLLEDRGDAQVDVQVVRFPGPALVDSREMDIAALRSGSEIRQVMADAKELDIIVTSAASWSDEHSVFRQRMQSSRDARERLEAEGVAGDILWRPLSKHGPIETDTGLRFLTLMELAQLPAFIDAGRKVLLLAGPCSECDESKSEVLEALLAHREPLITHLVIDSRTARLVGGDGGMSAAAV